jgi:predicted acetyltransferase
VTSCFNRAAVAEQRYVGRTVTSDLVAPTFSLADQFVAMATEYETVDEEVDFKDALLDFGAYLERTRAEGQGRRSGRAPCSHFWLLDSGAVVGTARVRHRLTPELQREIGHIGYDIRPSKRRLGYGSRLLSLTLRAARDLGLAEVLIVCDADNLASVALVERVGASFLEEVVSTRTALPIRRYSVALHDPALMVPKHE